MFLILSVTILYVGKLSSTLVHAFRLLKISVSEAKLNSQKEKDLLEISRPHLNIIITDIIYLLLFPFEWNCRTTLPVRRGLVPHIH